jgi:hypothetical protein
MARWWHVGPVSRSVHQRFAWWAQLGSNQRPLACKASALPLSYAPLVPAIVACTLDRSQRTGPWTVAAPDGPALGKGRVGLVSAGT